MRPTVVFILSKRLCAASTVILFALNHTASHFLPRYLKTIKMLTTQAAALSYRVITQQHVVLGCNFVKFLFLLQAFDFIFSRSPSYTCNRITCSQCEIIILGHKRCVVMALVGFFSSSQSNLEMNFIPS